MTYGYIRVSTDKQTVENQRFEIESFARTQNITIDRWIEETISGTKEINKRQLGVLLKKMKKGDMLICSELSRLGRTLFMIMDVLSFCMKKEVELWTIKEGYKLGSDITSKVLAFAFGISAELERNLISARTKEALTRLKNEGKVLGRPKGAKTSVEKHPLYSKKDIIVKLYQKGISQRRMAKLLKVDRNTLSSFIKKNNLNLAYKK